MNWYLIALKKYATFNGRSNRKEYWYFFLFNFIFAFILGLIDGVTGNINPSFGLGLLGGLYSLAVLIPGIAVGIRRLHDTDRSGWWILIILIPLVGALVYLYFMVSKGDNESNKYGDNPNQVKI